MNNAENWSKLYSLLRKELPRHRGNRQILIDIIRDYAKQCGILNLNSAKIDELIKKFA